MIVCDQCGVLSPGIRRRNMGTQLCKECRNGDAAPGQPPIRVYTDAPRNGSMNRRSRLKTARKISKAETC